MMVVLYVVLFLLSCQRRPLLSSLALPLDSAPMGGRERSLACLLHPSSAPPPVQAGLKTVSHKRQILFPGSSIIPRH